MMAGMSSTRSWVAVIFVLIPRAYLNSYFLAIVRAKRKYELNEKRVDRNYLIWYFLTPPDFGVGEKALKTVG